MEIFQQLGVLVERRWRNRNYNEAFFPEIACQAFEESNLPERVDPWEILRWVHNTDQLPYQFDVDARFGNPPVTLYNGSRFNIDVYYWLDGTTEIHQHAFSGAFQLLLGSSIHSLYHFEDKQEINPHFLTGRLVLDDVAFLKNGD